MERGGLVQGWNVGWREKVIGEMTGFRGLLWGYVKTYFSGNTLESTRVTTEKISNRIWSLNQSLLQPGKSQQRE